MDREPGKTEVKRYHLLRGRYPDTTCSPSVIILPRATFQEVIPDVIVALYLGGFTLYNSFTMHGKHYSSVGSIVLSEIYDLQKPDTSH